MEACLARALIQWGCVLTGGDRDVGTVPHEMEARWAGSYKPRDTKALQTQEEHGRAWSPGSLGTSTRDQPGCWTGACAPFLLFKANKYMVFYTRAGGTAS